MVLTIHGLFSDGIPLIRSLTPSLNKETLLMEHTQHKKGNACKKNESRKSMQEKICMHRTQRTDDPVIVNPMTQNQ